MSGKEFFINRYKQLGWEFREITLNQTIRFNEKNLKNKDLQKRLLALGFTLHKVPFLKSGYWVLTSPVSPGATAEYLLGLYSIQEAAAQIPATLFTSLLGKIVLDACAAPGGKTVQLADLMDDSGVIVALDVKKDRLTALTNHLERCKASNVLVYKLDARRANELAHPYERILLDVPCSGNFASDAKWFERRTIRDIQRNAKLQREILTEAVKCLTSDGELVYSTCSLEPEENELNIHWAIRNLDVIAEEIDSPGQKGLTSIFGRSLDPSIEKCKRIWPGKTQGFFVCKLRKRSTNHEGD